ncbi:hypothetical protein PIB30_054819 [Stylosanthes scabra]|uniref:Uncharacterized protein n=1 Tax=Stylosanthes scabra TaxID=79078 RepID=A0ABU6YJ31_9FABA|nr:hypothetical protein [Stylosanthes scabra]
MRGEDVGDENWVEMNDRKEIEATWFDEQKQRLQGVYWEFGSEVYSVESHPDRRDDYSESLEAQKFVSMVGETLTEVGESPAKIGNDNSNMRNVVDPLIDVITNKKLGYVHELIYEREICSKGGEEFVFEYLSKRKITDSCYVKGVRYGLMDFDPLIHESQITSNKICEEKGNGKMFIADGRTRLIDPLAGKNLDSGSSFSPRSLDGNSVTVGEKVEIPKSVSVTSVTQGCRENGVAVDDESVGNTVDVAAGDEEVLSDKTLYRINIDTFKDELGSVIAVKSGAFAEPNLLLSEGISAAEVRYDGENLSVESTNHLGGGEMRVKKRSEAWNGKGADITPIEKSSKQVVHSSEDISDEDNFYEAAVTKRVWDKGGKFFDSSDEEEVLTRLAYRKIKDKKQSKK